MGLLWKYINCMNKNVIIITTKSYWIFILQDVLFFLLYTTSKAHEADSISPKWLSILPKLNQLVSYINRILSPEARDCDCIILQNCFDRGSRILQILLLYCNCFFTPCSIFWKHMQILWDFLFILKTWDCNLYQTYNLHHSEVNY